MGSDRVNDDDELSVSDRRQAAYRLRTDPLFFKWQRGEAREQDWLDAVAAVRADYPLDEPPTAEES